MRRLCALILIQCLAAFAVLPALLAPASVQELPQCCRISGQHRCAMHVGSDAVAGASGPVIKSECPFSKVVPSVVLLREYAPPIERHNLIGVFFSHSAHIAPSEQTSRLAFLRANPKRGPPVPSV